jgi:hypothetical protein
VARTGLGGRAASVCRGGRNRGGLEGLPRPQLNQPAAPVRNGVCGPGLLEARTIQAGSWSLPVAAVTCAPVDKRAGLLLGQDRAEPDLVEQFVACGLA